MDQIIIQVNRWNHSQGKKVLLVHGFESNSVNFDRYVFPLVEKGYEVVSFDAPAHGKSTGEKITLPLFIKTIRNVSDRYGPFDAFIAHSFGGLAVTHFVESIPQNDQLKLVLIAPAVETSTAINSFFDLLKLNKKVRLQFDQLIEANSGTHPEYFSIRRAVKNIRSRILWFHDRDDNITPIKDAFVIEKENHPNIEFIISSGLGHKLIYRDGQVMNRVFSFL